MKVARFVESSMTAGRISLFPENSVFGMRRMEAGPELHLRLEPLPPLDKLATEWRTLERRADASFFTSWSWIGALLRSWPAMPSLRLLRAVRGHGPFAATVGLCLVNRKARPWIGPFSASTLVLNASGDDDLDRITCEHNDVLCERGSERAIRRQLLATLLREGGSWDELHLPGMNPAAGWTERLPAGLQRFQVREEPCFAVDLEALRPVADGKSDVRERYLATLSANTRSQIRRSIKEYEKLGPLKLAEAASAEEALSFLDGLRELHQRYWISRGEPGAFGHPYFGRFHRQLIGDAFGRGEIQMLRVDAGGTVIGYLYNFVRDGRVLNYQSGLDYTVCEKHGRPGLVAQTLAVAHNVEHHARLYDFMAGANRTKESLATLHYTMDWIVLRRPRLKFALAERLREAKRRWQPAGELVDVDKDLAGIAKNHE